MQCLRAALALAHQFHDAALMNDINRELANRPRYLRSYSDGKPLDAQSLAEVLRAERAAGEIPKSSTAAEKSVVLIDPPDFSGGGFFDPYDSTFEDDDDEDEDYYEDDYDDPGFGDAAAILPAEVRAVMTKILDKYGTLPNANEMERKDPKLAKELLDALAKAAGRKR
jgi:hypothetical protein